MLNLTAPIPVRPSECRTNLDLVRLNRKVWRPETQSHDQRSRAAKCHEITQKVKSNACVQKS
jgi:hypothetical protein